MLSDGGSSDTPSDEEDLELVLLDLLVKPKRALGYRLHLDDLPDLECQRLFR